MQDSNLNTNSTHKKFSVTDLCERAKVKLTPDVTAHDDIFLTTKCLGDHDLNPDAIDHIDLTKPKRKAAVLIPIIERSSETTVILTKRSHELPTHAGQISFPGGTYEEQDKDAIDTALREADEEIGLKHDQVKVLGLLDPYFTVTGFQIAPILGTITSSFEAQTNPQEVVEIFEVPLSFLMSKENHHKHSLMWQGKKRYYHAMPYKNYYIWGATAGIIHNLYERLYMS